MSMDLIKSYNKKYEFFRDITGVAMKVYNKYKYGLAESAYEAAIKYLLEKDGYYVECQAYLPIYWDDLKLDKNYRMDLVVNEEIIIELKAVSFIDMQHRKQLWNYMRLTHLPYGMLINFGNEKNLYSEWYQYNVGENTIEKIQLLYFSTIMLYASSLFSQHKYTNSLSLRF